MRRASFSRSLAQRKRGQELRLRVKGRCAHPAPLEESHGPVPRPSQAQPRPDAVAQADGASHGTPRAEVGRSDQAPPASDATQALEASAWSIALAGMVAMGTAMAIGRFAFTPLLPIMLHDGVINLPTASWLASSNYLGYMLGALLCTLQPWIWARFRWLPLLGYAALVRAGMIATGVFTVGMAWQVPDAWPGLRFAAGVTSAVMFVYTSGWSLSRLARLGVPTMGGIIYVGPGLGIVLSGLIASGMVADAWTAARGWMIFGALALVLSVMVWRSLRGGTEHLVRHAPAVAQPREAEAAAHGAAEVGMLTLAYGLAGFGYIITATFLPVIARAALPGSVWLDLFWPIFGLGVMIGALLATRLPHGGDLRVRLIVCYLLQALGIATTLWSPSLVGFALGSLLLGMPFTAIAFFAMQEVRRLRPAMAGSFIGLLTAAYATGQILGPLLVARLLKHTASAGEGFTLALGIAASVLVAGAGLYAWMVWAYPMRPVASRAGWLDNLAAMIGLGRSASQRV